MTAVRTGPLENVDGKQNPSPGKKMNNLLGVGERENTEHSSMHEAMEGHRHSNGMQALEAGLQRRMSEVMRVVDSVKTMTPAVPQALQRRMSNLQLVLSGDEPDNLEPCVVPQGEKHPYALMDSHTTMAMAVSEGYSHLFRVPVSRLQEVESFFL